MYEDTIALLVGCGLEVHSINQHFLTGGTQRSGDVHLSNFYPEEFRITRMDSWWASGSIVGQRFALCYITSALTDAARSICDVYKMSEDSTEDIRSIFREILNLQYHGLPTYVYDSTITVKFNINESIYLSGRARNPAIHHSVG